MLVKKWSEALVLYERVLKYAKEVQSKAKSLNNSLKVGLTCKQTHTHTSNMSHGVTHCGGLFSKPHLYLGCHFSYLQHIIFRQIDVIKKLYGKKLYGSQRCRCLLICSK